jgi:hypothetical protein
VRYRTTHSSFGTVQEQPHVEPSNLSFTVLYEQLDGLVGISVECHINPLDGVSNEIFTWSESA